MGTAARRILLTVSIFCAMAFLGLWLRSHFRWDTVNHVGAGREVGLGSARGRLTLWWGPTGGSNLDWYWNVHVPGPSERGTWSLGVTYHRLMSQHVIGLPYWLLVLTTAAPTVYLLARHARAGGRRTAGIWQSCGYDLRATPERCPECGRGNR